MDDGESDLDRVMDFDEERRRDFVDQGPMTDIDMQVDDQIITTLLKDILSCTNAAEIEQLLQDIPVPPPVAVPVISVQEAGAAGDLPPLDMEAA